ncbi:sensor histidine kinase [Streptomyces sp. NPDC002566]|uniref:sensor histidine kinase n=1 Tax=Streptomyces sp. NPDC002566 TaxID=3364650 RepID=UPI00367C2DE8
MNPATRTKTAAWTGGVCYLLTVGLLIGGAPRASGTVHGVGALLAVSLLAGVVRRTPLPALAIALIGSTVVIAGVPSSAHAGVDASYQGQFLSYLAVDLVLGVIVATSARRAAIAAVAVTLTVQLLVIGLFAHGDGLVVHAVIALLALSASCMAGLLSRERREHAVALRAQEVAEAVTAERLRIARELHDIVAHSIGVIAIQAGVGSRVIETQPAQAREALRAIETTSRQTLTGLRRTLVSLRRADREDRADREEGDGGAGRAVRADRVAHVEGAGRGASRAGRAVGADRDRRGVRAGRGAPPPENPPSTPAPGLADVEQLAATTADAGVRVDLRRSGAQRALPAEIELSAYRIVQEALTNVVRHAGAGRCRVTIDYGDEELTLEIADDGRGLTEDASGHGFGLVGMRERVALLHGRITAGPRPEGGYRVAARLPLPAPAGLAAEVR